MSTGCIYNIDLKTNNNDVISISSDLFDRFYVANLDDEGDEISYGFNDDNKLVANFFMIKILNTFDNDYERLYKRLNIKKDIIGITLCFTNGERQEFEIPKKRITRNGAMENKYQENFNVGDDIGIIVTDKNIKYKKELFI